MRVRFENIIKERTRDRAQAELYAPSTVKNYLNQLQTEILDRAVKLCILNPELESTKAARSVGGNNKRVVSRLF